MKSDIKERWLTALRSGKYKQGKRALTLVSTNNEKTYCCLGVLCDILSDESDLFKNNGTASTLNGDVVLYGSAMAALTFQQSEYVELSRNEFTKSILIYMNDSEEYTFDVIADYIEDHL